MPGEKHLRAAGRGNNDAATSFESPGGFFQSEENALGVRIENPVVVLLAAIRQRLDDDVGGVGDDDIQFAESFFRFIEHAGDFSRARQIRLDSYGLSLAVGDGFHDLLSARIILEVADHDGGALRRQSECDRAADSTGATGDERCFSLK